MLVDGRHVPGWHRLRPPPQRSPPRSRWYQLPPSRRRNRTTRPRTGSARRVTCRRTRSLPTNRRAAKCLSITCPPGGRTTPTSSPATPPPRRRSPVTMSTSTDLVFTWSWSRHMPKTRYRALYSSPSLSFLPAGPLFNARGPFFAQLRRNYAKEYQRRCHVSETSRNGGC